MFNLIKQNEEYYTYQCDLCGKVTTLWRANPKAVSFLRCECEPIPEQPIIKKEVSQIAENCNLQANLIMPNPPNRELASLIYKNWDNNLVITGPTGSGKSTAITAAVRYLNEKISIPIWYYPSMVHILNVFWKNKKTEIDSVKFYSHHKRFKILIIDEAICDTQPYLCKEMLFELVDSIYRGENKTRLWLVGNFKSGCFEKIFDDPKPFYRRMETCFKSIYAKDLNHAEFFNKSN